MRGLVDSSTASPPEPQLCAPKPSTMANGIFITATGTAVGKTFVARGLTASLRRTGQRVAALKPFETGCAPAPKDAEALARASGIRAHARDPAFYRAEPPLSPYAATLQGTPAPDFDAIRTAVREIARQHDRTIVEGAGGLLVPIDASRDMATFATDLAYPVLLIAPNRLGVLSSVLTAFAAAFRRDLKVAAVVLTEPDAAPDLSSETNARILRERLEVEVLGFPHTADEDEALADAIDASGLRAVLDL
jgi:dethiobiotin synthetase